MEKLARDNPTVADVLLRLSLAPVSVAVGMVVRQVLAHSFGADELPVYIFFFPMVMLTAVLAGFWPGIASMVLSALVCSYILFNTPFGSKPEISPAEEVGLIFFVLSSIFISVLASLYRRHRERIAFHEREAALNASRLQAAAEWEHTFNSITDPVALLDTENLIVRANTAMAALQFMSVGQCSGQPCYLSQLCEEQLGADSPYALTLADGQRHVADVRIVSQGLDYTVSASPYRNEQGRIESIILVAHDITVRKHIESVLIANEERLNLALHAAKAGTWELDLAKSQYVWSEEIWTILGLQNKKKDNAPNYELWMQSIHPDCRQQIARKAYQAVESKEKLDIEWRVSTEDQQERWVHSRGLPLFDDNGQLIKYIGIAMDITERKHQEHLLTLQQLHLKQMAFALQQSEEAERLRIAGELHDQVGHRLLLAKMKLDSLASRLSEVKQADEAESVARLIEQSIHDTRSLTFQLRPPVLATVGLEAALRQLCNQMMDDYGLLVELHDDESSKPLQIEYRTVLYQAVRELLMNVVKHAETKQATLKIGTHEGSVVISIADTGVGFEPTDDRLSSHCYGLFNISQRMQFMGGSYQCLSKRGQGTQIVISLPLEQAGKED